MPTITGLYPFKYQNINAVGGLRSISNRTGLISLVPLAFDTFAVKPSNVDTHYMYRALPCNYIFEKKYPLIDRIDSVYIPVVIYSKPVNGVPVGCYGAGGVGGYCKTFISNISSTQNS